MRLWPGHGVHLPGNLIEQASPVFSNQVQVKMRSARNEREVLIGVEPLKDRIQFVRRAVQIKRVRRAHVEMHLAPQVFSNRRPLLRHAIRDVVMLPPIRTAGSTSPVK